MPELEAVPDPAEPTVASGDHPIIAKRQSVVTGPSKGVANRINDTFSSYAKLGYFLPFELLDYIELVARFNPDYSQAVDNIKTLANSGHELFVSAGAEGTTKRIKDKLESKARTIQVRHGGIDGVIDKLLNQAATFGAMCGEWVIDEDLSDVVDFADINPKSIRFFWEDNHWAPYQKVTNGQAVEAKNSGQRVRNGNCVKLNEETFHYFAFDAAPNSPYGTPPFLAALRSISIQDDMVENMARIVKKMGLLSMVDLSVERLPKVRGEDEDAYMARAQRFLTAYAEVVEDMITEGGIAHFNDAEIKTTSITGNAAGATNIFKQNEEQIFSGLKSMPSVQGRSYCVVPETRVLSADLRWVTAGSLEFGDELVGFDEHLGKGQGRGNVARLQKSVVEMNRRIQLDCVKVTTNKGSITVSKQHPLVRMCRTRGRVWTEAADLKIGDRLSWFGAPWQEDRSYESGYLAGMFDGEGTMGRGTQQIRKTVSLRLAQLQGPVLDETERALKELCYTSSTTYKQQDNGKVIGVVSLLGGRYETMRFLGSVRPHRFMAKSDQAWEGAMLRNSGTSSVKHDDVVEVIAIEDVGEQEVVALQTSTRTFIAEGLLNHNSTTETYAGVAYDIIIRNTFKYQRAAKRMIEAGYWLMNDLWGERANSITLQFNPNKSLHRLQNAQARLLEIKNGLMMWATGIWDQNDFAMELGESDIKTPYDEIPEHAILGNTSPGGGAGATSTDDQVNDNDQSSDS